MEHINQLMKWQSQITAESGSYADMDVAKRLLKHGIESLQENEKLREHLKFLIENFDDGGADEAPGHSHREKGKWDADGSVCLACKGWNAAINSLKQSTSDWLAQHDQQVQDEAYEKAALHFNSKQSYEAFGDTIADEIRNLKGTVETGAKGCQVGNSGQK